MKYKLIDCCPVPEGLYDELVVLKKDTGCVYQSIYRGTDAADLLAQCGKHDQAWLYANLPAGVANPPGFSTHELKSDGVAYSIPRGSSIEYWMVGLDIDDSHVQSFIDAARKRGWVATITYPGSSVEYHHVNFRKEPEFPTFHPLQKGDDEDKVKQLIDKLMFIYPPHNRDKPYLGKKQGDFNDNVEDAVKAFQSDHKLTPDGIVGKATWQQLLVSVRNEKQKRAILSAKRDLDTAQKELDQARKLRDEIQKKLDEARKNKSKGVKNLADRKERAEKSVNEAAAYVAKTKEKVKEVGGK
jgi:putative peptidoglycan binding protein